ncbi:MAG: chemotaxis protein CheX [Opitutaceae bacterium]|nr:chemotaxis protein CheX [Opitutaceae bacterium]
MPAVVEISEALIRGYVTRAVTEVFKTMTRRTPTFTGLMEDSQGRPRLETDPARPQVVGSVGFIGEVNGLVYLHFDLTFARLCACQMLGLSEKELDAVGPEVINDAMGELTNMTAGGFKNGLCDVGYPCKLTIPSILRGTGICVQPIRSVVRHVYQFECAGHRLWADIQIKADE